MATDDYLPVRFRETLLMNVFLSWSGDRSKAVAFALHKWLPKVIQRLRPWMSASDVDAGTRWKRHIDMALQTDFGVICLTPENQHAPWIQFEAGSVAKSINDARVIPYLFDMSLGDVVGPLSHFQNVVAAKEGTLKLVESLNAALGENALRDDVLADTFNQFWPELEKDLARIPDAVGDEPPKRDTGEIVEEILAIVRSMQNSMPLAFAPVAYADNPTWLETRRDEITTEIRLHLARLAAAQAHLVELGNSDLTTEEKALRTQIASDLIAELEDKLVGMKRTKKSFDRIAHGVNLRNSRVNRRQLRFEDEEDSE